MADFLSALGNQISSQFMGGEMSNDQRTLSGVLNGRRNNFAKLGDFAKQIDQSAQRNYLEEGYLQNNLGSASAKMTEILMQEPNVTVFVKKKMYGNLAKNFDPNVAAEEEKLTYLAMDRLILNKCKQISAYEKLCKIQLASQKVGEVDEQIMPIIIGLSDSIMSFTSSSGLGSFGEAVRTIKGIYNYSSPNFYTSWIEDIITPKSLRYGYGTGVIELTNFTSVNTSVALSGGSGNFSINIDDPYELLIVTPMDIEYAISDVINSRAGTQITINLGKETQEEIIQKKMGELDRLRKSRGASSITFIVNPNTMYGRKVVAIVDAVGQEIPFEPDTFRFGQANVAPEYLLDGAVLGFQGLSAQKKQNKLTENVKSLISTSELSLFSEVINGIYNKMSMDQNSIRDYDFVNGNNADMMNYIRRKLTFYFAGKAIIQPTDSVSIFIASRSKFDSKVMSGIKNAFTGFGLFQNFSNTVSDLSKSFYDVFAPGENLDLQMEKSLFLGNTNFPDYIWNMFRTQFTSEKEGCHVFAGVVETVRTSFSDGSARVSVNGQDNTYHLKQGIVNFNPGVNTNSGAFYDPLTPYDTKFDSVYTLNKDSLPLLKQNQELVSGGILRYPAGQNAGKKVTEKTLHSDIEYSDYDYTKQGRKIIYAPDGLVYKWKEGIGIFNMGSMTDATFNEQLFGQQSSAHDALAGQDVMNTISFLVTGIPYNYVNFLKTGLQLGQLTKNSDTGKLSVSRLSQLSETIKKNNALWGGFMPFKNLTVDDKSYQLMLSTKVQDLVKGQAELQEQYKALIRLQNDIVASGFRVGLNDGKVDAAMSQNQSGIDAIKKIIDEKEQKFLDNLKESGMTIIGDDLSTDYDYYFNNGGKADDVNTRRQLRRKTNYLTRRVSWRIRANQDVNFFIVDDNYDKNYDLQAFETDISGQNYQLYHNEYTNVFEKITAAAGILDLEFFADTQGHLRIRTPQYNRMPSSVFYKMLQSKKSKNAIQIFPQFLNDIFFDQIQTVYNQITVCEDKIRLFTAISDAGNTLNIGGDIPAIEFINGSSSGQLQSTGKPVFDFLSSPATGEITNIGNIYGYPDINAVNNSDRTSRDDGFTQAKILNGVLKNQLNIRTTFDISGRVKQLVSNFKDVGTAKTDSSKNDVIKALVDRVFRKTGVKIKPQDYISDNYSGQSSTDSGNVVGDVIFPKYYSINKYAVSNQISKLIQERQKCINRLYSVTKNAYEINSIGDDPTKLLSQSSSKEIPEALENMLEDESFDDYGPGSGARFIIKNSQIISYEISEKPPAFTSIQVTGTISKFMTQEQSKNKDYPALPLGGDPMISSCAIDYDTWKMYGFRSTSNIHKPFLTNPQTQTGPVAAAMLARERKRIISGSITIAGNEYMQPGEVIFLEQKGMLFYIESVNHTISMGGDFQTTLSVSFGHYPGEYIPTQLDLAGRMLYSNQDNITTEIRRNPSIIDGKSVGCFVLDPSYAPLAATTKELAGQYDWAKQAEEQSIMNTKTPMGNTNANIFSNIATQFYRELNAHNDPDTDLQLRLVWYKYSNLQTNITKLTDYLSSIFNGQTFEGEPPDMNIFREKIKNKVVVTSVDLSNPKRRNSPSGFALSAVEQLIKNYSGEKLTAKSQENNQSGGTGLVIKKEKFLASYIVDCFIKEIPKK